MTTSRKYIIKKTIQSVDNIRPYTPLKFVYLIIAVVVVSCILFFLADRSNSVAAAETASESVVKTPYALYKLVKSDNYLNIGVQPLYLPAGLITSVMSRDMILHHRLEELGIKIVFYQFLKGSDVNSFLKNDSLQAGVAGDMPTISAAALKDIFIPALIQHGFTSVVSRRYLFIKELRGRRIGYAPGSNAHYALLKTLSNEGLTEKDVTLIPMDVTDMPKALLSKKIFAFSAWEPTVGLTEKNYPDTVVIHRFMSYGYIYFLKEFYQKHPEAVKHVLAAEIRAIRWLKKSSQNLLQASTWTFQASQQLSNNKLTITADQIADIAMGDMIWQNELPVIPKNSLKSNGPLYDEFNFLVKYSNIQSNVKWEKIQGSFDTKLLYELLEMRNYYELDEFDYDLTRNHQ
ncbi:MAG: NrtA/SsuA/CpmA family ABC transporter substrate-binding protein [Nitrospirae bacterium]|nr:NrtA/SsuA/CpmA family ABC transporter substrate-binding protein [Nitrospirota bacterium]